ncbi:uncharacterized protein LOC124788459, partial [Schistocerca piceifrons]|uniref:uncharacterized protein LOC124788459 n=1 Tax=Schistocerca piceifrons TaxID=274613 RepID=UPI001F5FB016
MVTSEGMVSLEVMVTLEMIGPEETMGAVEARCPRGDVARDDDTRGIYLSSGVDGPMRLPWKGLEPTVEVGKAGDERWVLPQAWIRPMGPLSPEEGPPISTSGPGVVVRAEEALIVLLVLVLWLAAIALFFNRWGKIRMLEPYQPKFQQQHRVSCPMVDINAVQHRSFSKFNLNCLGEAGSGAPPLRPLLRPRQNSVFVGGSGYMLPPHLGPPRKAKSAADLQTLV